MMKFKDWILMMFLFVIFYPKFLIVLCEFSSWLFKVIQNLLPATSIIPQLIYILLLTIFILLFMVYILGLFTFLMVIIDRVYVPKHIKYGKNEKYAAVLIVKSKLNDNMTLYLNGISFLLWHFKNIDKNYKVFTYPTIEEFKNIVCKKDVDELYIFGHGRRGQLKFEETPNSPLKYNEFEKYNLTKKFVGQYHCNSCKQRNKLIDILFFLKPSLHTCDSCCDKSLADYLSAQERDVTKVVRISSFTQMKFISKWFKSFLFKNSL